ncbi:MAG: alpha/beta hydrolase [Pseudomonadales bacterium]|nr:alpha/beta hydrolase [Pseudomonadales bacterium]
MKPFFFGSSAAPLYGVYLPPQGQPVQDEAVLLLYPFGQEYMRAHRAFRQLALLLSKKGFHVMRFDYSGTGNSYGEMDQVNIKDWVQDTEIAIEELRETANVKKISLVGLRLGALIAAHLCSEKADIERLVLWDPVLSGVAYENEILKCMEEDEEAFCNEITEDGSLFFNGFGQSSVFREELKKLNLLEMKPQCASVLHVVSNETEDTLKIKSGWGTYENYQYNLSPAPGDWNYVDSFGGILLPQPVIQSIVNWLS